MNLPGRTKILREARAIAKARGRVVREVFDDSLAGDVARFQVRRRVRQSLPAWVIEELFEELLTP